MRKILAIDKNEILVIDKKINFTMEKMRTFFFYLEKKIIKIFLLKIRKINTRRILKEKLTISFYFSLEHYNKIKEKKKIL